MLESAIERHPTASVQPAASQLDRVHVSHVPKNRRLRVVLQPARPFTVLANRRGGRGGPGRIFSRQYAKAIHTPHVNKKVARDSSEPRRRSLQKKTNLVICIYGLSFTVIH